MKNRMGRLFAAGFLGVVFTTVSACAPSPNAVPPSRTPSDPFFVEKEPGTLKKYDSFYVSPIVTYIIEGDALRRVSDLEVTNLAEKFRSKIIRELGDRHAVLPHAARNVAILNVAIADVSISVGVFQLMPGYIVPNPMRGGASIEAEVVDSVSKEVVAVFRDSRQGARQGYMSGLGKWDGANRAFDEWAQRLAANLRR